MSHSFDFHRRWSELDSWTWMRHLAYMRVSIIRHVSICRETLAVWSRSYHRLSWICSRSYRFCLTVLIAWRIRIEMRSRWMSKQTQLMSSFEVYDLRIMRSSVHADSQTERLNVRADSQHEMLNRLIQMYDWERQKQSMRMTEIHDDNYTSIENERQNKHMKTVQTTLNTCYSDHLM
jgi:hypothetical protein